MSEVLTEILKVDPSFDKDAFLKQCERDIIPNILEVRWALNVTDLIMSKVNVLEWTETINRCVCDRRFVVFLQAMIRGELEVLKDWCYEAVRSSTQTQMLADLHLLCHDFIFCLFADVQSARSSRSTGQSHGTPVPLQDSGHRQHRRKQIKTFMRPKNPTNT